MFTLALSTVLVFMALVIPPLAEASSSESKAQINKVEAISEDVNSGDSFTITVYGSIPGTLDSTTSSVELTRKQKSEDECGNGKYIAEFNVDENWVDGDYTITSVRLSDINRNYDDIIVSYDKENIIPKNVVYSIKTNNSDAFAPEILSIEAKSGTYYLGEEIPITVYLSDPSGIDDERSQISISVPGNIKAGYARFLEDKGDGIFETTFKVDKYMEEGDYVVVSVTAYDKFRNHITYTNEKIREGGDPLQIIPDNAFTIVKKAKQLGDSDGDGTVDAKDLTILAKHLAKIENITNSVQLFNSDTTKDNDISAEDLTQLAKYVARIIPEL